MRSRRAWIYILSVAALLVPAGGIAYLGAVSYRDERGAIAAQDERQRQAATGIADRINRAIGGALDSVESATTLAQGTNRTTPSAPLARYWFWIDADGQMRAPHAVPGSVDLGGALDRTAPCAQGTPLEDCVRELATRQTRVARLQAAQRAEACRGDACGEKWTEAKRQYTSLVQFDDTGHIAQLGLARTLQLLGDSRAPAALAELEKRFADRTFEGVPVTLVVAMLRAQPAGADALLDVADSVLDDKYSLDPIVRLGVLARIRGRLAGTLSEPQARRRAELDERVSLIRSEARAAAGLADDVPEIVRTAGATWRGRAATHVPQRTVIYRRRADGGVIGISVDAPMLEEAAGQEPRDVVAKNARALVMPSGAAVVPELRRIVQVPLGEALPHLTLAIVNPIADPDPRDEVIRERSKRHIMYTSALAVALGLGLLLMIRGAARARELAQLKSDFVSTVSHELKTPLTSIRMFAEMLEQGVAQGDPAKMARYHGVIVQESQRLGLLIANLLDYAQIEKGTRRYTPSRQDLAGLARLAVTTFETLRDPDGERNSIEVEVSPESMRADVEVDRDVVVQAVLNLLANAAKYGGAEKPIEVAAGADATGGWISVRDHGPGIPPVEQARIFREFYRSPEAYRSGVEGTGLGLALVKRHIEALGGTVEVASELGQGATFTIRLPRVQEQP
ncbi:MAG: HAMP domain-containing histidine kinase [Deltaproteobacteria bacterium]|nr:HAMP domain-containing histidine kinase [Deltaproteobacteria bacterium]